MSCSCAIAYSKTPKFSPPHALLLRHRLFAGVYVQLVACLAPAPSPIRRGLCSARRMCCSCAIAYSKKLMFSSSHVLLLRHSLFEEAYVQLVACLAPAP